jgi:hypothetical protein
MAQTKMRTRPNLFALLPFRARSQTSADARERVKVQVELLNSKYVDEQVSFISTTLMIVIMIGVLALNHQFKKIDDQLAINIALLAGRFIFGTHQKINSEAAPTP